MSLNTAVGRRIKAERVRQDLTIRKAAKRCNLDPSWLSNMERGKLAATLKTLVRLAVGLGVELIVFVPTLQEIGVEETTHPLPEPAIEAPTKMDLKQIVGKKIRKERKHKELTIANLSDRSGVRPCSISDIEQGKIAPTVRTLVCLALGLQVNPNILIPTLEELGNEPTDLGELT